MNKIKKQQKMNKKTTKKQKSLNRVKKSKSPKCQFCKKRIAIPNAYIKCKRTCQMCYDLNKKGKVNWNEKIPPKPLTWLDKLAVRSY